MNILPKKSWHVRSRKNIERVRRDEAEAERQARIEQDRILQVEQEARVRELRLRLDPSATSDTSGHINLFEKPEDNQQFTNKQHDDERRQDEAKAQQRAGLFNKLVRAEDVNMPWYCQPKLSINKVDDQSPGTSSNKQFRSDKITSIYDPLITMKHADEIARAKRAELKLKEKLREEERFRGEKSLPWHHETKKLQFQSSSHQQSSTISHNVEQLSHESDSSSSPEIVKIIKGEDKGVDKISSKRNKHSKSKSKKHKRNPSEHRHKHRHKKHKR